MALKRRIKPPKNDPSSVRLSLANFCMPDLKGSHALTSSGIYAIDFPHIRQNSEPFRAGDPITTGNSSHSLNFVPDELGNARKVFSLMLGKDTMGGSFFGCC